MLTNGTTNRRILNIRDMDTWPFLICRNSVPLFAVETVGTWSESHFLGSVTAFRGIRSNADVQLRYEYGSRTPGRVADPRYVPKPRSVFEIQSDSGWLQKFRGTRTTYAPFPFPGSPTVVRRIPGRDYAPVRARTELCVGTPVDLTYL